MNRKMGWQCGVVLATLLATLPVLADDGPKKPFPPEKKQAEALKLIGDLFKEEYALAKTPAEQLALAKRMLEQGKLTTDDDAGQFVLFKVAKNIAVKAGDWELALQICDEWEASFNLAAETRASLEFALQAKLDIFLAAARTVKESDSRLRLLAAAEAVGTGAVKKLAFPVARQCFELTLELAKEERAVALSKSLSAKLEFVNLLATEHAKIKSDLATLLQKPTDPTANLNVGRFYCIHMRDWERGVPMLALGSDPILKALAIKELEDPEATANQMAIADGWWEIAGKAQAYEAASIRDYAGFWYQEALPKLEGLNQLKVLSRVAEIQADKRTRVEFLTVFKKKMLLWQINPFGDLKGSIQQSPPGETFSQKVIGSYSLVATDNATKEQNRIILNIHPKRFLILGSAKKTPWRVVDNKTISFSFPDEMTGKISLGEDVNVIIGELVEKSGKKWTLKGTRNRELACFAFEIPTGYRYYNFHSWGLVQKFNPGKVESARWEIVGNKLVILSRLSDDVMYEFVLSDDRLSYEGRERDGQVIKARRVRNREPSASARPPTFVDKDQLLPAKE